MSAANKRIDMPSPGPVTASPSPVMPSKMPRKKTATTLEQQWLRRMMGSATGEQGRVGQGTAAAWGWGTATSAWGTATSFCNRSCYLSAVPGAQPPVPGARPAVPGARPPALGCIDARCQCVAHTTCFCHPARRCDDYALRLQPGTTSQSLALGHCHLKNRGTAA
jgi:hypothetical protein